MISTVVTVSKFRKKKKKKCHYSVSLVLYGLSKILKLKITYCQNIQKIDFHLLTYRLNGSFASPLGDCTFSLVSLALMWSIWSPSNNLLKIM